MDSTCDCRLPTKNSNGSIVNPYFSRAKWMTVLMIWDMRFFWLDVLKNRASFSRSTLWNSENYASYNFCRHCASSLLIKMEWQLQFKHPMRILKWVMYYLNCFHLNSHYFIIQLLGDLIVVDISLLSLGVDQSYLEELKSNANSRGFCYLSEVYHYFDKYSDIWDSIY